MTDSATNTTTTLTTMTMASTTVDATDHYNPYEFKRSRSASPFTHTALLDFSYLDLEECEECLTEARRKNERLAVVHLMLNNNLLRKLPAQLEYFSNIEILDISSNQLKSLYKSIHLPNLKILVVKDNLLTDNSLPKDFAERVPRLERINLSGNAFSQFPYQLLDMSSLREINLGSNKLSTLPRSYERLQALEILYLGGNHITCVPDQISQLRQLTSLNLADNLINRLPRKLAELKRMKTLSLHGNRLTTLPIELVKLNLEELSLRNNPLVNRFAKEHSDKVPSLLELSGRVIKMRGVEYKTAQACLPRHLVQYLNSAQCCLNPKCEGVYFQSKFECIKFVDFCGKYRIPLMQYLCSSSCDEKAAYTVDNDTAAGTAPTSAMLKKIYVDAPES